MQTDILKKLLFLFLLFFNGYKMQAQTVGGIVLDSISAKPIEYTTVHLLNANGQALGSTYTNERGAFQFMTGNSPQDSVWLQLSASGYEDLKIRPLQIIRMRRAEKTLTAVTVAATRRVVELKPGMIVYNAENDASNKGGTAADVLRKAPVLNVDGQGNVSMRGSGNLKILINGKHSGQIARSPADALNMMPADMIKAVEVITTPSARYDAEGAAGIINIITKKNRKSFSGNLEISAGNREQMINPRITTSSEKWNFSLHGHLHRLQFKEEQILSRTATGGTSLQQDLYRNNAAPHGSADIGLVFTPRDGTEWSLGSNIWFGNWPKNNTITTRQFTAGGAQAEFYTQDISAKENYLGADIYFAFDKKLRKANRSITVLGQVTPARSEQPYNFSLINDTQTPFYGEKNTNNVKNREYTLQVDYMHPFDESGKYTLETGIKTVIRNASNSYAVQTQTGNTPWQTDPQRSDLFKYSQDIWAGYGILKAKWSQQWFAEGGLRYEATDVNGRFERQSAAINNSFHNLVPSFNLTRKLGRNHMLGLSYTQRITRPYIWDLNPNANASDPKNIQVGNPDLDPEIMHQAEISYGLQGTSGFFLNAALFGKRTDNAMIDFTEIAENGVSTTRKENMASNTMYGLNLSTSARPGKAWSINTNVNINYLNYLNEGWQVFNKGWAADFNLNNTFTLSKTLSFQAFGEYTTRKVTVQGYETGRYYYVFSIKKEVAHPKLTLSAAAANPFSRYIAQTAFIVAPSFNSSTLSRDYYRSFRITLAWEFGSNGKSKTAKKVQNKDVNMQGRE